MKHHQTLRRGLSVLLALVLCLSLLPATALAEETETSVEINETNFPDKTFREQYVQGFDTDKSGTLSAAEIEAVTSIDCSNASKNRDDITSLKGIEHFTALTTLECYSNQLTTLDVSSNTALTSLKCQYNQLTTLDVSSNTALTTLYCYSNQLTSLDVSSNTALTQLNCESNQLTTLDLSKNTNLTMLSCGSNQLTSLNLSKNTNLTMLSCGSNQLTSLDLSSITSDNFALWCSGNSYEIELTDGTFDLSTLPEGFNVSKASGWSGGTVSENTLTVTDSMVSNVTYTYDCGKNQKCTFTLRLKGVLIPGAVKIDEDHFPDATFRAYVSTNFDKDSNGTLSAEEIQTATWMPLSEKGIASLEGIKYFTELTSLDCGNNQLTSLDVSNNTKLEYLYCGGNSLTSLDLSNNTKLEKFVCSSNEWYKITLGEDRSFDLSTLPGTFNGTMATWPDGVTYNVSDNTISVAETLDNISYTYDCGNGWSFTTALFWGVDINEGNFPDEVFRSYVSEVFDRNENALLEDSEIAAVDAITVPEKNIASLKGVEYFTKLERLNCRKNNLTSLDLSKNTKLEELFCNFNGQLTSLNVSGATELTYLNATYCAMTSVDVSHNSKLKSLYVGPSKLVELDLSNNPELEELYFISTNLVELDLSKNPKLKYLYGGLNTSLTVLDVSKNPELTYLRCTSSSLTSLDCSNNPKLTHLEVDGSYNILLDENRSFDLTNLPGNFDGTKANFSTAGVEVNGTTLTVNADSGWIDYSYNYGCINPDGMEVNRCTFTWLVRQAVELTVTTQPTKTTYVHGDTFDPTGMVVKATFDYGNFDNDANFTGYTVVYEHGGDCMLQGDTKVILKSGIASVEVPVTVGPATGDDHTHSYGSEWESDADSHWHECSCGAKSEEAAHTASDWIIDTAATATTDGSKHKECTICGYVMETAAIPATGDDHTHSYGSEWKSDADNHWHECSCGAKSEETAHTASDWIIDTAATATTDGSKHKECTICGYVMETATIPATGGSSSSGSSSGGSSTSGGSTVTPTEPEITTDGGTTVAEIETKVTTSGTTSKTTVSQDTLEQAIEAAESAAEKAGTDIAVEIVVETPAKATEVQVNLPTESLESFVDSEAQSLTISSGVGTVTISSEAAASIAAQAKDDTVTVIISEVTQPETTLNKRQLAAVGDAPVYDLSVISNGKLISQFDGGLITVTLPYTLKAGENPNGVVVYYVDDQGGLHRIRATYDVDTQSAIFTTNHFSFYMVRYESEAAAAARFTDVPVDAYYQSAVGWAVIQGVTSGTTETTFAPDAACTRAQAVTFLWRAAGSPAPESSVNPFADVAEGSYYYDAVLWAVEQGITKGTSDTTFSPNATCTRAQIVTFLWRSQKSPAAGTANPFTDVAADAYYTDAVLWAVENGITAGTTATTFSPASNCTRAQIVTFLFRCLGEE